MFNKSVIIVIVIVIVIMTRYRKYYVFGCLMSK